MSQFPTNDGLFLMLCDDFRHEGDGKLSIFGVFSDSVVVQELDAQGNVSLASLGIFLAFRDGLGNFKMSMAITSPKKTELIPPAPPQPVEKKTDAWMTVAIKLQPFLGTRGDYSLKISLEDENGIKREYVKPFYVKINLPVPLH